MTLLPERHLLVGWLNEAIAAGARWVPACLEVGISLRTLQRCSLPEEMLADGRTTTMRPTPHNALREFERQVIVALCNSKAYAHLPPSRSSHSWLAKVVTWPRRPRFTACCHAAGQQHHRSRARRPHRHEAPTTYAATAANQVWSWDVTYRPSLVASRFLLELGA